MKKLKNVLITIAILIAASVVGWFIFRFAVGIVFFIILAVGFVSGFFIAKFIYQRKKDDKKPISNL